MSNKIEDIYVNTANYSKEELQTLLNEWKAGKFPNLKKAILNAQVRHWKVIEGYEK